MKRICVFAGSNLGNSSSYQVQARYLGEEIAKSGLELVYGGSSVGLMGEVANTVLERGGTVIGVLPTSLFRGEFVHPGLTRLIEVKDMHERKATMGNLSDAFIALPGGYGTFEELFEVISWAELGIHQKPIGLLNVEGYYTPLLNMIDHAIRAGFVQERHKEVLVVAEDAPTLIKKLQEFVPASFGKKWDQLAE